LFIALKPYRGRSGYRWRTFIDLKIVRLLPAFEVQNFQQAKDILLGGLAS
jgi:hypothetical protein